MKKISSVILAVFLLTATASAVEIKSYQVDNESKRILVEYAYAENDNVSIVVYDVSKVDNPTVDTPYIDGAKTPIIQLNQEWGDGKFELKLKDSYTGKAIIAIARTNQASAKAFIEVEQGTVKYITLDENDVLNFATGDEPQNSVVNTQSGTLKIGTTNVKGVVRFNAEGAIQPNIGDSITMETAVENGTRHIGFIGTTSFDDVTATKTLTVKVGGKTFTNEIKTAGLKGNVMYQAAIQNVPSNISAEDFTITFE